MGPQAFEWGPRGTQTSCQALHLAPSPRGYTGWLRGHPGGGAVTLRLESQGPFWGLGKSSSEALGGPHPHLKHLDPERGSGPQRPAAPSTPVAPTSEGQLSVCGAPHPLHSPPWPWPLDSERAQGAQGTVREGQCSPCPPGLGPREALAAVAGAGTGTVWGPRPSAPWLLLSRREGWQEAGTERPRRVRVKAAWK